jgi:hypothetical protein
VPKPLTLLCAFTVVRFSESGTLLYVVFLPNERYENSLSDPIPSHSLHHFTFEAGVTVHRELVGGFLDLWLDLCHIFGSPLFHAVSLHQSFQMSAHTLLLIYQQISAESKVQEPDASALDIAAT